MIHYTLLPPEEMKHLRLEYRMRLFIVAFFFISCSVVIGIISIIPSYLSSNSQETQTINRALELKKKQQASGADQAAKDLAISQRIANRIIVDQDNFSYYEIIQRILFNRPKNIYVNSFEITKDTSDTASTTPVKVIVEAKAATREDLVTFKDSLDNDKYFSKVELPISDFAKNKDVVFSLRLTVATGQNSKQQDNKQKK